MVQLSRIAVRIYWMFVLCLLVTQIIDVAPLLATPARLAEHTQQAGSGRTAYLPLVSSPRAFAPRSYWGMNLYLTKVERRGTGDNLNRLADLSAQAGVRWTREELVWDLIEPRAGDFRPIYDESLRLTTDKGFGVIGMLLTTPQWARDTTCRPTREAYWCPPAECQCLCPLRRLDGRAVRWRWHPRCAGLAAR